MISYAYESFGKHLKNRQIHYQSVRGPFTSRETESSVPREKSSRKRKAPELDVSDISPKKRRLNTHTKYTATHRKTGKTLIVSFVNQDSHPPGSCTEVGAENWDKPIPLDGPHSECSDSIVHIH